MIKTIPVSVLALLVAAPLYAQDDVDAPVEGVDGAPAEAAEVVPDDAAPVEVPDDAAPVEGAAEEAAPVDPATDDTATTDADGVGDTESVEAAPAGETAPDDGVEPLSLEAPEATTPIVPLALPEPDASPEPIASVSRAEVADTPRELGAIVIGIHAGPSISPFNDLAIHGMPRLELGYNLGVAGDRLEVFATGAYTQPPAEGTITDDRMPADTDFELVQDEVTVGVGALFRLFPLGTQLNPYGLVGPQVVLLQSTVNGDAGTPTGENTETRTEYGAFGAIGAEYVLGPGAGFFQVGFTWSDLDARITGDTNTGTLSPAIGYRLML